MNLKINDSQLLLKILHNENKSRNTPKKNLLSSKIPTNYHDLLIKRDTVHSHVYSSSLRNKYISQDLLKILNNVDGVRMSGDIVECGDVKFSLDQIPPINKMNLKEVLAKNNVMDFGKNTYSKYISKDGKEHFLFANQKSGIGPIFSEELRGGSYDSTLAEYAEFWNYLMSDDPVYIGLTFSDAQVSEYMDEANIKPGFFTVKIGEKEATQFYSATKTAGPIHSKERYDKHYKTLTSSGNLLSEYAAGDIFKINGKEYALTENHTLDIPYGEDIYNIEHPKNYYYGRRIPAED